MAKKSKTVPSIPEVYTGVVRDTKLTKLCMIEDTHNQYFLFESSSKNSIVKEAVQKIWPSFDSFAEQNKATLLTYHSNLFNAEPPKDQDLITTAVYCWYKLCMTAQDRTGRLGTQPGAVTPIDPTTGKRSNLLTRKYFFGSIKPTDQELPGLIKTPQAIACYRIFRDALGTTESISENDLKTKVIERAGELRTRQEPWRIFQYYRPTLMKALLLRHD